VGGLGHILEREGLATASISLIRPHTEKIRPPRALWVPFELGRPLGVPNDAAFQRRVLTDLLDLLKRPSGPVLVDFDEDAPGSGTGEQNWEGQVCPVRFDRPTTGEETLAQAIQREIGQLQPWYDLSVERRGRSTFGGVGLDIDALAAFLLAWLDGGEPPSPKGDISPAALLKLAAEEFKAFYTEAMTAQPGQVSARQVADWFWSETSGAKLFVALREVCLASGRADLKALGLNLLVPREQWGRFGIDNRWWHNR
jgi:hypothetical protein